jgi:hypothetical protein
MILLSLSGFDGQLKIQTEETKMLLHSFLVGGLTITFAGAFLFSRGINLKKSDVEMAQKQLENVRAAQAAEL